MNITTKIDGREFISCNTTPDLYRSTFLDHVVRKERESDVIVDFSIHTLPNDNALDETYETAEELQEFLDSNW